MADKRELILDAMQAVLTDKKSDSVTISDVAKKAGIAKGGIYYYFNSKDEIIDALLERSYLNVVKECREFLENGQMSPIEMMREIFNRSVFPSAGNRQSTLLKLLSNSEDVIIHRRFSVIAAKNMTPVLTRVIEMGVEDGTLKCDYPQQYAQFILSMILLSLDSVLIPYDTDETEKKLMALAQILEMSMCTQKGSFAYLYKNLDNWNK